MLMSETYIFVGGPLDGQTTEFTGTASWWGGRYEKDGIKGEYNTCPYKTYKQVPYGLYWWEEGTPREMNPDWELSEPVDVEDLQGQTLEEHIARLIREQTK